MCGQKPRRKDSYLNRVDDTLSIDQQGGGQTRHIVPRRDRAIRIDHLRVRNV